MYTFRLWVGSAVFAFGIGFWVWFFRNLARPRFNRAKLFVETSGVVIIIWNIIWVAVGLWIYPVEGTVPVIGLIVGLIFGWRISR